MLKVLHVSCCGKMPKFFKIIYKFLFLLTSFMLLLCSLRHTAYETKLPKFQQYCHTVPIKQSTR